MNDSDGCGMHLKMTLMDLEGNNICPIQLIHTG